MQMVIFHLKQHVSHGQHDARCHQIDLVRQHGVRAQVDESQRHHQLQAHINQRNHHMTHLQLIRHQLVRVLSVRLPQVLMQHNAVENGQRTVDTINKEEYNVCNILSHQHQASQRKQDDERNTDAPHIPGKALRVPLHHHQHSPHNHGERENHASPAKHDGRVRRPLIRFVDDVEVVCYLKVHQLCNQQDSSNNCRWKEGRLTVNKLTSVPMSTTKGRCASTSPGHKMFCFLRQKHNILTVLHRNSQDFQSKIPKIFNFPNPCSHLIFLQFSHFYEILAKQNSQKSSAKFSIPITE